MRVGGPSILFAIVPALLLGACSTVEKLNPFGSGDPKAKAAELTAFQPSGELKIQWKDNVGSAGAFTFSPAVVLARAARDVRDCTVRSRVVGGVSSRPPLAIAA